MAASGDAGGEGGHKGAGASRRNDATPRLLKGAGLSSGARRRRVPEDLDFARIAGSRPGQTGASGLCRRGVRWTRAAREVRLGGVRSPTGGLRSGRRDGRGQRSVRPSARYAPTASAQLFPRGVPLLRRAPGPRRGGDTGTEEHPGGCQPVHQVKRGPGGAALPGARGRGEAGVSPEPLVPTPQLPGSLWSPLSAVSLPADTPAGPHSLPPRRTALMASAGPGQCPPQDPTTPGVDPGPQSPRPPFSSSHRPALAGASEPRRPPDAVLGRTRPRDREQGLGGAQEELPPRPGPARGSRVKFAGRSPPNRHILGRAQRRGSGQGASLPRSQTNTSSPGVGRGKTLSDLFLRMDDPTPPPPQPQVLRKSDFPPFVGTPFKKKGSAL